ARAHHHLELRTLLEGGEDVRHQLLVELPPAAGDRLVELLGRDAVLRERGGVLLGALQREVRDVARLLPLDPAVAEAARRGGERYGRDRRGERLTPVAGFVEPREPVGTRGELTVVD